MWSLIQKIVDSVFPPSSDELLVRACSYDTLQNLYQPHTRDGVTIILPYQDPTVRALIHLAKFQYHARAQRLLAHALQLHLKQAATTAHWLVPVPLSRRRWRERGYNQVHEVAKRAAPAVPTCTLVPKLLQRTRHTRPQTELARADRLSNLTNAFRCRPQSATSPAIIILDDVCTTGSTLRAAHNACKHRYPNIPIVRLALAG